MLNPESPLDRQKIDEALLYLQQVSEQFQAQVSAPPPPADAMTLASWPPSVLAELRKTAVSMSNGDWDSSGILRSTPADVDRIFSDSAQAALDALPAGVTLKLWLFAHGGLVSEDTALKEAQGHIAWLQKSHERGIYPIYFIWKTGILDSVKDLLEKIFGRRGLAEEAITDPVIAKLARAIGGEKLWSVMKDNAQNACLPTGVAYYVAQKIKEFCDRNPGRVELHAIGHSAGSNFHCDYVPMSTVMGNQYFVTTNFMAPAVQVESFLQSMTTNGALKPEVGALSVFTMNEKLEKQDNCAQIYHQSLLYLIFHAFEAKDKTPLLGLQESILKNGTLEKLFGLSGFPQTGNTIVWSQTSELTGRSSSQATSHGGFSDDCYTLASIFRRVAGLPDGAPVSPYKPPCLP